MNAMLRMHRQKHSMALVFSFLFVILFTLILSPMSVSAKSLIPHVAPATSWSMYGFDAQHTNNNPYEKTISTTNVSKLRLAWQHTLPHDPIAPVSVLNGLAYESTEFGFFAIDIKTGITKWRLTNSASTNFDVAPVVANGLVYVESDYGFTPPVSAYNALTGKLVWTRSGIGGSGPMTYDHGKIYIFRLSDLEAINATNGHTVWDTVETNSGDGYSSGSERSPAVANGIVYTTTYSRDTGSGYLLAFNATTGKKLWQYATGIATTTIDPQIITGGASVANGIVYFSTLDDRTYAINATTGKLIWSTRTGTYYAHTAPAIANGIVYSFTGVGLYALNATTGKLLWTQLIGDTENPGGSRISIANGIVYSGQISGTSAYNSAILAFNAQTGKKLWSYNLHAFITYSPIVVNGMLYIGACPNNSGALFAFKLP